LRPPRAQPATPIRRDPNGEDGQLGDVPTRKNSSLPSARQRGSIRPPWKPSRRRRRLEINGCTPHSWPIRLRDIGKPVSIR
jgi:hypothetical protein